MMGKGDMDLQNKVLFRGICMKDIFRYGTLLPLDKGGHICVRHPNIWRHPRYREPHLVFLKVLSQYIWRFGLRNQ